MKIRITEIEANAEELNNSNTLAQNLNRMLARAFAPTYKRWDDDESEEDDD